MSRESGAQVRWALKTDEQQLICDTIGISCAQFGVKIMYDFMQSVDG